MNTFNVVVDTWNVFGDDTETMLIVYAVCHMVGMSSVSSLNCCVWNFFSMEGCDAAQTNWIIAGELNGMIVYRCMALRWIIQWSNLIGVSYSFIQRPALIRFFTGGWTTISAKSSTRSAHLLLPRLKITQERPLIISDNDRECRWSSRRLERVSIRRHQQRCGPCRPRRKRNKWRK